MRESLGCPVFVVPLPQIRTGVSSDVETRAGRPFPSVVGTARWAHLHLKEDGHVDTVLGIGLHGLRLWGFAEG